MIWKVDVKAVYMVKVARHGNISLQINIYIKCTNVLSSNEYFRDVNPIVHVKYTWSDILQQTSLH
jgi:hypothetical protein